MSGFGQAPVFGAQAFSSDATNSKPSPFGAASDHSPFPQSSQGPAFGAPATFSSNSFQQPQNASTLGSYNNATNAFDVTSSNVGGFFDGLGTTNSGATMSNPFTAGTTASAGAASNPFATQSETTSSNPFVGATPPAKAQHNSTTANPFASTGSANSFNAPSNTTNGAANIFGQPVGHSNVGLTSFVNNSAGNQKRKNAFEDKSDSKRWGSNPLTKTQKPQASFATSSAANSSTGFGGFDTGKNSNGFADHFRDKTTNGFGSNTAPTQALALKGQKKSPSVYAKEIHDQLRKDNLKPPPWPKDPGDPNNLKAMDDYRVRYKKYESRVRTSLIKAGLIDDPDVRKKLSDAIDFRGICEDMCPEGEKVSRIVEYDVKQPERTQTFGKEQGWANPDLMVKTFKRSAAGTDSPLPTEVRSPAALRRTLDYLIDDLLKGDGNLRDLHGFLWDRTRAIRKDFIFQNAMTPAERTDQIYCLENITRFHAVSLHLLSKEGAASEGFSEQQEREQLGKTLLSLMQVYDECKDMDIIIENEAQFRAYYLLFNAHDPFVIQQMQDWNDKFWFNSSEIQTVVALIETMQNVWNGRGPLRPAIPLTSGSASFSSYFSIVEDPKVSYTMACLAEIHFTEIRRHILKSVHRAYGRVRDGPKDLTAKVLNDMFRFDTEEECVAFLKDLDMEFSSEGASEPYLLVERRRGIPGKTIKQSFSQAMVERKRGDHSLPEVVHNTVFEISSTVGETMDSPDSLFVTQFSDTPMGRDSEPPASIDVNFSDNESPSSSPAPTRRGLAPPPTSSLINGLSSSQEPAKSTTDATLKGFLFSQSSNPTTTSNPFFQQASAATVPAVPAMEKFPSVSQPTASWESKTPTSNIFQKSVTADRAEGESPKPMPTFPWSSTTTTTPAVSNTETPGSVFDFLSKPAENPSFMPSTSISTPLAASSIFQKTSLPDTSRAAEAPPATRNLSETKISQTAIGSTPSMFSTSTSSTPMSVPTLFTSSAPATTAPEVNKSVASSPVSTLAPVQTPAPAPAASRSPAPPKDLMGGLAKWVLLGDDGLMEKLQEKVVEDLVRGAFEQHQREEKERKRKEEDENSWAEARKFRKYSLRVKFFYRWREITRKRSLKRVGRQNREALKAYREAKAVEARTARAKKQKEEQSRLKRLTGPTSWLDELERERALKRARRESMSFDTSQRSSPASDADALLATGIFSGVPNQQEIAENCVRDDDSLYDALVGVHISPNSKRQIMGPPAKPNKDPLRAVRDAGISKPLQKQKLSKKAQYLADLMSGKQQDDDLISFKSSTSSYLGQSARAAGKFTNFMKYQSLSPRSSVEPERPRNGPSSGIKSPYWLLRSRGLFATPTGHVLSDKAPRPRPDSLHDGASQYSGDSEIGDYNDRVLEQDGAYRASMGLNASRRSSFSVASARSPLRSNFSKPRQTPFRQSLPAGVSSPMLLGSQQADGDAISQTGSAMSTIQQDVEETLRELKKVAAEMDDDTNWYREQNKQMSQGHDLGS